MALLESCCGCSLATSSAVLGVYLLIAYIIAFMIELWWILDSSVTSPVAAYLLCLGYFILFAFSTVLLRGLSIKRITYLLLWLFMMGILLGPEAGLVLYMSIHYWRITSVNGLIEITCWACRLLVNAIGILCVQSLHSNWREEKSVLLRLEALKSKTNQDGRGDGNRLWFALKSYKNPGFEGKETVSKVPLDGKPYEVDPTNNSHYLEDNEIFKPGYEAGYVDPYFTQGFNEFNAFSFDPAIIDARLPYLTIRKKPKELVNGSRKFELDLAFDGIMPKTHSLVDLTAEDLKNVEVVKFQNERIPQLLTPVSCFEEKELTLKKEENPMSSLDKKIIKNKNLKVLKKLSPFCRKKSVETINIYPINPPSGTETERGLDVAKLDTQLNTVYSNRGMYTFEEKSKKIFFYPPEFFQNASPKVHRNRTNSFGNLSHSSMDSEDIKQIGDVAL